MITTYLKSRLPNATMAGLAGPKSLTGKHLSRTKNMISSQQRQYFKIAKTDSR